MSVHFWFDQVKTRKDRRCFGCLDPIPAGTTVQRQTAVDAGDWWRLYVCASCQDRANHGHLGDEGLYEGRFAIKGHPVLDTL